MAQDFGWQPAASAGQLAAGVAWEKRKAEYAAMARADADRAAAAQAEAKAAQEAQAAKTREDAAAAGRQQERLAEIQRQAPGNRPDANQQYLQDMGLARLLPEAIRGPAQPVQPDRSGTPLVNPGSFGPIEYGISQRPGQLTQGQQANPMGLFQRGVSDRSGTPLLNTGSFGPIEYGISQRPGQLTQGQQAIRDGAGSQEQFLSQQRPMMPHQPMIPQPEHMMPGFPRNIRPREQMGVRLWQASTMSPASAIHLSPAPDEGPMPNFPQGAGDSGSLDPMDEVEFGHINSFLLYFQSYIRLKHKAWLARRHGVDVLELIDEITRDGGLAQETAILVLARDDKRKRGSFILQILYEVLRGLNTRLQAAIAKLNDMDPLSPEYGEALKELQTVRDLLVGTNAIFNAIISPGLFTGSTDPITAEIATVFTGLTYDKAFFADMFAAKNALASAASEALDLQFNRQALAGQLAAPPAEPEELPAWHKDVSEMTLKDYELTESADSALADANAKIEALAAGIGK